MAGWAYIHAFDNCAVMANPGTIAPEWLQHLPTHDIIATSIDGGALIEEMNSATKYFDRRFRHTGPRGNSREGRTADRTGNVLLDCDADPVLHPAGQGYPGRIVQRHVALENVRYGCGHSSRRMTISIIQI